MYEPGQDVASSRKATKTLQVIVSCQRDPQANKRYRRSSNNMPSQNCGSSFTDSQDYRCSSRASARQTLGCRGHSSHEQSLERQSAGSVQMQVDSRLEAGLAGPWLSFATFIPYAWHYQMAFWSTRTSLNRTISHSFTMAGRSRPSIPGTAHLIPEVWLSPMRSMSVPSVYIGLISILLLHDILGLHRVLFENGIQLRVEHRYQDSYSKFKKRRSRLHCSWPDASWLYSLNYGLVAALPWRSSPTQTAPHCLCSQLIWSMRSLKEPTWRHNSPSERRLKHGTYWQAE